MRCNPSGEIQILAGGDVIVIQGNHLEKVFQGLNRHLVVYVQELSRGHDQVGGRGAVCGEDSGGGGSGVKTS